MTAGWKQTLLEVWYNDDAFHSPRLQERHFLSGENSNDRRLLTSSHSILPLFLHIRNTWINNSELKHHHRTFLFTLHWWVVHSLQLLQALCIFTPFSVTLGLSPQTQLQIARPVMSFHHHSDRLSDLKCLAHLNQITLWASMFQPRKFSKRQGQAPRRTTCSRLCISNKDVQGKTPMNPATVHLDVVGCTAWRSNSHWLLDLLRNQLQLRHHDRN